MRVGKRQNLSVFLHDDYVGTLYSEAATLGFRYDEDYLKRPDAAKISISMPLQKEHFDHQTTSSFFSNLLPDDYVRKRLARYLGLSEKNTFGLLKEIGGECAGSIAVYEEGHAPHLNITSTYRILDTKEAHDVLSQLDKRPMLAGEADIRISGAGAQDKLVISFVDGKIAIPTGNTPSTHSIKPAIKGLEDSVQNEFFCMKLGKLVGLPVPEVTIYWLEGQPYYLVERYDRIKDKQGMVSRLHQEDFCQILHVPPEHKYENEGGPNLEQCFSILDARIKEGFMAGRDKITLLQGIVFNFLIGNGDAHAKNFSILYKDAYESLAPFYDLMCTIVYANAFKAKMAMKLDGKYRFQDVSMRHFRSLDIITGYKADFIEKQIHRLVHNVLKESVNLSHFLNIESSTYSSLYERIINVIQKNARQIGFVF